MNINKSGKVKLSKGQNSGLNLRIPKNVVEKCHLRKGDEAKFIVCEDTALIKIKSREKE